MPKSRVTCVMQRCDTSEKHQSSSVPIFQPNVSNFSTFQFWSLSIVGSFSVFCLSSELCFSIKIQKKKKTKKFSTFCFPQSDSHLLVFRISISDSELALRRLASQFIIIFSFSKRPVDVGCFFSTEQCGITSWYYSGFGTKLSPIFGFAKSSQVQTIFPIKPNAQIRCSSCYAFVLSSILVLATSFP